MPIPLLIGGIVVAALGLEGHKDAKDTNEKAERVSRDAQRIYNNAKLSLEASQESTEKALLKLGYSKMNILNSSMRQFVENYAKVQDIYIERSNGLNELSKFSIDQQGVLQMQQMSDIYSEAITSTATGAATGAVVALAASGELAIVTETLGIAGSALMAGEIGAAAGIAGSALSFGAAMTPLGAIAAPIILFTGISASLKADENLEKANEMYAQAEETVEKMKTSETLCNAITERSDMFDDVLNDLNGIFSECTEKLEQLIHKKEKRLCKKKSTSDDFSDNDLRLLAVTRALAGAVETIIDTPILSKDGMISTEFEEKYNSIELRLPDLKKEVLEVRKFEFDNI